MSDADIAEQLGRVALFAGLSRKQLQALAKRGREVSHPDGHEVTMQGQPGAVGFHLVLDGTAAVSVQGVERRTLKPGDYFGEISLIDGKPRSATVRAEQGLRTFGITAWDFRSLLDEQPDIAKGLLATLCARLREAEARPA